MAAEARRPARNRARLALWSPMHPHPRLAALAAGLALLSSACLTGGEKSAGPPAEASADKDADAAAKASALDVARLELKAAQLEAASQDTAAGQAVGVAETEVEQARKALEQADKSAAIRVRESENALKRARVRLDETKAELGELQGMYAEEDFAEKTKELVLARGQSQVDLATAELEVEGLRHDLLTRDSLPRDRAQAELALRKAEIALEAARAARDGAALRGQVAVRKAAEAVRAAEVEAAGG
jgi:hypothetical protein